MKNKNRYFLNIILLLILLIIVIIIVKKLNYIEKFTIKNEIKNIFDTEYFDNKEIFLIANNPNITEKTRNFLDNYDTSNSVIVRFNSGMKKAGVKNLFRGKTDIIVYRKHPNGYHGYSKENYIKTKDKVISVFTDFTDDIKNIKNIPSSTHFDKNKNFKYKLDKKHPIDIKDKNRRLMITRWWDNKHYNPGPIEKKSMSTGFNFLFELFEKINKIKKIYLIGFTFHGKKNGIVHDEKTEYEYFLKNMNNNKKIQIML